MLTIENITSGVVLGAYEADTETEALDKLARDAGYASWNDVPNADASDLAIYAA